jgi:hypothetical protein
MRILIKVLLFPITLLLSITVAVFRFACHFSGAVLGIASSIVFILAVLALILLRDAAAALNASILAFVISPYGIPKLAEWLVDRLDDLNGLVKSI